MRHLIAAALAATLLLLQSCSHAPPPAQPGYLLPGASHSGHSPATIQVQLAGYLNQGGIVLQLSDTEIHVARQHRWAEPLGVQLQRALQGPLDTLPDDATLTVRLSRFHGQQQQDGDSAVISGDWEYQQGENRQQGEIQWQTPLEQDGYAALVKALDQGWQDTAQSILQALKET